MKHEDKLCTLEEAIEFDKKRNYQYTAPSDEVTKLLQEKDTKIHSLSCENKFLKNVVEQFESMTASNQLSDEEIQKAEYEFLRWNRELEKPLVRIASELYVFRHALAILKKAGEKMKSNEYYHDGIPLFPQSKQLSDEEIIKLGMKLGMYEYGYIDDPSGKCLDFARAILKKASKK